MQLVSYINSAKLYLVMEEFFTANVKESNLHGFLH